MIKKLKKQKEKEIVSALAEKFGISYDRLAPIRGGYQNRVFEVVQSNKSYIFRVSDSETRKEEEIKSELKWCLDLSKHGVPLSRPLTSRKGQLSETVTRDGVTMIGALFEKAPGRKMSYPEYLGDTKVFYQLGQITGKLHKASKIIPNSNLQRNPWSENHYLKNLYRYIPETEPKIRKAYDRLVSELKSLKQDPESYGLIHGDINVGNFCILEDRITLFDFDECQFSWFVEDIAIQLFYTVYPFGDDSVIQRQQMADKFMQSFMSGYRKENSLDDYWIEKIPEFLKLRELIVHVGIYKKWDFTDLNEWQKDYLDQSASRIKKGSALVKYQNSWKEERMYE